MIIEANEKFYRTTLHADENMLIREISEKMIAEALENAEMMLGDDGQEIYLYNRVGVVVDEDCIITVFRT